MLSIVHRFHGHGSLKYLYRNGRAVRSRLFIVKYVPNTRRRHSRFSVVVSKKVLKSAVGRNRIRRRIYEIIRHELPQFETVCDVAIIITSSEVRDMKASDLSEQLLGSLRQTDLYKKPSRPAIIHTS